MEELHCMHGLALFAAAVAGLAVAHCVVLRLPIGLPRLVFILPILPIFFMLPWTIPIYHLRAILSFIFLWTVPSKLLLLCWDAGIDYPSSGFLYFATIVMMPIRVKGRKAEKKNPCSTRKKQFWWQFIAVIVILNIYSYRNGLPLWAIYVLYTCHMYLGLELMLGGLARLATACFGVESDPQFNNPFMSASLSEFWGRRWNLVVTTILRSTVYNPALLLLMRAEQHKAHESKMQGSSCAPERAPRMRAPNSHEQTSTGTDLKNHQNRMSTAGDTTNTQVEKMKSSTVNDANVFTITQIHKAPVTPSAPTSCGDVRSISLHASIHPSSDSEVHVVEPVEDIQHADQPIADVAAGITNSTPTPNCESQSESKCNPSEELNPSFGVTNSNDGSPECKPNTNKPYLLLSDPDTIASPCPNPELTPESDGVWKPTLRARTVAMITKAAKQKRLHAFMRFGNAEAKLNLANTSKIEADGRKRGMSGNGEKPSLRARAMAMLVTFAVSGLVHELIFYYINKSGATGEVTAFFILHGCATATEVLLKKTMLAHLQLPRPLSIALTLAFLYATAAWLFMPALTRYGADINTIAEYQRLQSAFLSLFFTSNTNN